MDNEFDPILDAPMIPQDDWLTDEQVLRLELEEMTKTAAVSATELKKKRELESGLIHSFKKNPAKDTFVPLYNSFKPLILKAAQKNMFGSPIPQAAHIAYAQQSFLDATRTWDPAKGAFNTHVFNTVAEKGKRLNLKYQNIGYIPEARATKYQAFNTTVHLLREELGREPSTLEIADEMSLPPAEIERMRKEVRQDLVMNENLPNLGGSFAQTDKAMQIARDIQYSLIPKHQLVLEHALGLNGNKPLVKKNGGADVQAIAKAAKIPVSDVRSAFKTITRKFKEHRGTIGKKESEDFVFEDPGAGDEFI